MTAEDLLSAPVPAVCTHKAGKLVHGAQPGIPADHGVTELAWLDRGPQIKAALTAFGNLSGGGGGDAATVLACNAGGVPWPDIIAFYSPGPKLLGWVTSTEFNLPRIHAQENASALKISYRRGEIEAGWSTQQEGDPAAISSLDYSATLRLSGHKITASNLTGTTSSPRHTRSWRICATAAGPQQQLATPTAVAEAAILIRSFPSTLTATPKCYGLNDQFTMPAPLAALIDPGGTSQSVPSRNGCVQSTRRIPGRSRSRSGWSVPGPEPGGFCGPCQPDSSNR